MNQHDIIYDLAGRSAFRWAQFEQFYDYYRQLAANSNFPHHQIVILRTFYDRAFPIPPSALSAQHLFALEERLIALQHIIPNNFFVRTWINITLDLYQNSMIHRRFVAPPTASMRPIALQHSLLYYTEDEPTTD
jgi:hypothetical protein